MRMSINTTSSDNAGSRSTASDAVAALGDDLEPVLRRQDPRDARAHDRLVVDETDADHAGASTGSRHVTRQPPGVGPASRSPPSAAARSRMPTSP